MEKPLKELVPPNSETITELLRMSYSLYIEINKKLESMKKDEVNEFSVKHNSNIIQLLAKNLDMQVYGPSSPVHSRTNYNKWINLIISSNEKEVKLSYNNTVDNPTLSLDKDHFGYPDYMKVFYFLQDNGIYPTKGRIAAIMLASATDNIKLNPTANFDLANALHNLSGDDIKYLDFLPLVEKEVTAKIQVNNVKMMLPKMKSLNFESYVNWSRLLKSQVGITGTYESYTIDIEEED